MPAFKNNKISGFSGLLVLLIFLQGGTTTAATLHVGLGLDPQVPGNYTTVQAAINASSPGDVIMIGAGIHPESNFTNPSNFGITIRGAGTNLTRVSSAVIYNDTTLMDLEVQDQVWIEGHGARVINIIAGGRLWASHVQKILVSSSKFGSYGRIAADDAVIVGNEFHEYLHFQRQSSQCQCYPNRAFVAGNTIFITRAYYGVSATQFHWEPIYFASQTDGVFKNNLIVRRAQTEISAQKSLTDDWTIQQNTFTLAPPDMDSPTIGPTWKNNIITTPDTPTIDANGNLVGNPNFADPDNDDYSLAEGSPAIDAGIGLDIDGSQADIGYLGGTGASVFERVQGSGGQPEVGYIVVQPDPVAPGESIRIRFDARTN